MADFYEPSSRKLHSRLLWFMAKGKMPLNLVENEAFRGMLAGFPTP